MITGTKPRSCELAAARRASRPRVQDAGAPPRQRALGEVLALVVGGAARVREADRDEDAREAHPVGLYLSHWGKTVGGSTSKVAERDPPFLRPANLNLVNK